MTAYIEYVFLENFILDGLLLFGSCRFTKTRVRYARLCLSAGLGGIYALLSPFIRLPVFLAWTLKVCVGACLCLLAFGRIRNKKDGGRYAFFLTAFFLFTFVVAGLLLSFWDTLKEKPPFLAVLVAILFAVAVVEAFLSVHKRKHKLRAYLYDCYVLGKNKRVFASGYLDSGNLAEKDGLPICFLSPLIYYEAFGGWEEGNEKRETVRISTMSGEREVWARKGEIILKARKKEIRREVYFSPSKNMLVREYDVILPVCIIEEA